MLEVRNLRVLYDELLAIEDVSFEVREGEIVTLLGSNGAGKTTTINTISRLIRPAAGEVWFEGERIDQTAAHRIVELGIAQVPEGRRLWPELTVYEALDLGAYARRAREQREQTLSEVLDLFPKLAERRDQLCGTLSGGEQQMVAIGRALMSRPKLLMLDEPSLGLAPILVEAVFEALVRVRDAGTTVLLVEQNVNEALETADRGYVLETGRVVTSGTSEELRADEGVRMAYLGI
ncbi:MAG: ABC transporter ATP-binding protein [Solirubrobacterales bacterium]|jgi:branched-chain amino acid transport system ATP-binding protein